eukprot:TRINITY_DN300_c0_g1_i2.p1 TRINITY_DN300_c0_g1~~TRINITY_DN300_c0_g1_i2.p1  ORF type:complete len:1041 (+),score=265.57 TRINITY_DN300_c0_g1_i2:818-3940(+)
MSLESKDHCAPAAMEQTKDESQKRSKISYSREFLLRFAGLDICKRLPDGFDASILSDFKDAHLGIPERQRVPGGLSLQRFASTPLNRVDGSSNYARGSHGRWDTRSSGSNDRDGDSSSDRDSVIQDSGIRSGNHTRRTWQHPEHDGLLGSGAFPRPSGYTGSASAPRGRGNGDYQLNRSNEPYQPPRFYKGRQDTDSRNDETFGSAECSSEDRAEEERKRRESFELMRKEQHNALKEKKKHPDKHKGQLDIDIVALLKNSEDESLQNKIDDRLEDHVASISQGDSVKCSFPAQAPASRPLVPPGFASAALEKNLGTKSLVPTPAPEVGNTGYEDSAYSKSNGSGDDHLSEKQSAACIHFHEQQCENRSAGVPLMDANENNLVLSGGSEASNCSFSIETSSYKSSSLLEAGEGGVDSAVANSDSEKVTRFEVGTVGHDQSTSILEKLFNNALAVNGVDSPNFIEHNDVKSDGDTWSTQPSQASKFAHWFLEEEMKPVHDASSSKARDLLSLIASHDNGPQVSTVSNEKGIDNISRIFPLENTEVSQNLITPTAATSTTVGVLEPFYHCDKPDTGSGVLTCEDLEQSILAEADVSGSNMQHSVHGAWNFLVSKVETQKAAVDDHASQHLLSLLQKGTSSKVLTTSTPNLDAVSSDKLVVPDSMISTAENVHGSENTLTLETLFGTAFMKELQSVEAPVSVHRGSTSGVARTDVPEHHGPFSIADDGFFHSTVSEQVSNKPNLIEVPQPDKIEGHWFSFNDPRLKGLKLEPDGGFEGRVDRMPDVRLPEEESLIAVGDLLHRETSQFMPVGSATRVSSEPLAEIVDKLAALNTLLKNERPMVPGLQGPPVLHGPYEPLESMGPYQHLHGRPPPQFPHQMNNARHPFNPLDQHPLAPERIHQDPQHTFPPNIIPHPFNGPGGPRFDPVHSAMQQMPRPENFPPHHLLHGLPRGVPLPRPFNNMPGYIPEMNLIQGFPFNHQHGNYGGNGLGMPGSAIGAGHRPEVLERLIEMELRGNQKQTPPVAPGHGPGIYGSEFEMAFRHR